MIVDIKTQIMNYLSLCNISINEIIILYIINDWPFELSHIKTIQMVQEDIEEVYRTDWNTIIDFFDLHGLRMTETHIASIIDNLIKKGYLIEYTENIIEMIKKIWFIPSCLNHFQIQPNIGDIGISPIGEQIAIHIGRLLKLSKDSNNAYCFFVDETLMYYSTNIKKLKQLTSINKDTANISKCGPWIGHRWWHIFPCGYTATIFQKNIIDEK